MRIQFLPVVLTAGILQAGELGLQPETLHAWREYVAAVDATAREPIGPGANPETAKKMRAGEVVVSPGTETNPNRVPFGLIHHWRGAAFIPNTRVENVIAAFRDYARYKEIYKPLVFESQLLRRAGDRDDFHAMFRGVSYFKKSALDGEYTSSYVQLDRTRWYSMMTSTRIREIDDYRGPGQRTLPEDTGSGYIWRLHVINRFEERDGGVYFEIESLVLSRDLPAAIRWIISPIIRKISRDAVGDAMRKTRDSIRQEAEPARLSAR